MDVHSSDSAAPRALPPVDLLATATLVLIVVGGIFMASYVPRKPPLALPIALLVVAVAVLAWNSFTVSQLRDFDRDRFLLVLKWSLLAYFIQAFFLEYVFLVDGVRGGLLVVLTGMLLVFATNVPLIIAFTVAKFAGREPAQVPV